MFIFRLIIASAVLVLPMKEVNKNKKFTAGMKIRYLFGRVDNSRGS